tara:strand:- start:545 stop:934 length:390 start_codon:yes stop_codon:yes gene_type:complete
MLTEEKPWALVDKLTADAFILKMLEFGTPIETSVVGVFDDSGRGSRRDIPLPMHRDGDYSTNYKGKIDIVGLYCIREGKAKTIIEHNNKKTEVILKKGQALIFDNKICRHAREGTVGDRLLMRLWISKN